MARLIGPMFTDSPLLALPILSLALFLGAFVLITVRTYRRRAADYASVATLPLADDDSTQEEEGGGR